MTVEREERAFPHMGATPRSPGHIAVRAMDNVAGMAAESWDLVVDLLQTAIRTDGRGQLNISKLLRASARALIQSAAAARGFPDDSALLARDLRGLSDRLRERGADGETCDRIAHGSELVGRGQQAYCDGFPDPHVCRRCGTLIDCSPTSSCRSCGAHELTFERFEPAYWLTLYRPHEVIQRLAANPDLFLRAIHALGPERWTWTPPGTTWAAADVLRHVRDADALLAHRISLILDQQDPPLEFKAVFALTSDSSKAVEPRESVIESYVNSRAASVVRLRELDLAHWNRTGRHEELGRVTLIDQASYFAAHEVTHLRQLEQLRRALATASDQ